MLRALLESGVAPDVVVGTSVGAFNGAVIAAEPSQEGVRRLSELWEGLEGSGVFSGSVLGRAATLARTRTHAHSAAPLQELIERELPVTRIEDLAIPFQCVAASIERAAEHWFDQGSIVDAVLASSAVPGLLPPHVIGAEHFFDGGLVNSIPVARAVELGASTIYVLQVGRVEQPLQAPTKPWEVALVAFEIARRHRFATAMSSLPPGVTAHLLPSGDELRFNDLRRQLRFADTTKITSRIEQAHLATSSYLADAKAAE
jgi:NTE family protein